MIYCWYVTTEKLSKFILLIQSSAENGKNIRGHFIMHGAFAKNIYEILDSNSYANAKNFKDTHEETRKNFYWDLWTMN